MIDLAEMVCLRISAEEFRWGQGAHAVEQKEEKIAKLYEVVEKSAQLPLPKRALLGWKCPKCSSRLSKNTAKAIIFSGEGGSDFAKKVVAKAGLAPGLYSLTVQHFTCKQGDYEFARADVEEPADSGA